jgi:starvation-inducible DNA-binding protein
MSTNKAAAARNGTPRLQTPTDLGANATKDIAGAINALLADTFALYLKTKNFHWHMSGRISATIICCSTSSPTRSSP